MSQTLETIPNAEKPKKSSKIGLYLALLVGLGVAAWVLTSFYRSLEKSGHGEAVSVDVKPSETSTPNAFFLERRAQNESRRAAREQAAISGPDYVRPFNNDNKTLPVYGADVKGGKTRLAIRQVGPRTNVSAANADPNFLPADVRAMLKLRLSLENNVLAVEPLHLTADQKAALLKISGSGNYPVDAATRKRIEAAFAEWHAAPDADKPAKSQALIALAKELDGAGAQKALKDASSRAAAIKAILTSEQFKAYDAGR